MNETIRHIVVLALIGASSSGCAGATFGGSKAGYDEQGCVENAIRRNPDKESLVGARTLFERACATGDPAACSALGVLFETGRGAPRDAARAQHLYEKACHEGNARGCTNLGLLLEHGLAGLPVARRARDLYARACDDNERSGCANLGRLYKEGKVVPRDFEFAKDLLDRACVQGETSACLDLAEIVADRAPQQALSLYVNACVAGEASACARLSPGAPKAGPAIGATEPVVAVK